MWSSEVDPLSRFMGGIISCLWSPKYPEHAITKNFGYATMFPLWRGLAKVSPLPKNVTVDFLASTSPSSGERPTMNRDEDQENHQKTPRTKNGPIDIAAAIEISGIGDQKGRAVICGDSDFATNEILHFSSQWQFLQQHHRLAGRRGGPDRHLTENDGSQDPPFDRERQPTDFLYSLVILPLLVFIAGIGIWLYRRKL